MYHNRLLIQKQPRLYFEPAGGSFVAGLLFSFSCINYLAASHLILIRWCHYYSTKLYCIIWSVGNKSYFTLLYFTICSTDGWLDGLYLLSVQQMDDWLVCICRLFNRWMTGWSVSAIILKPWVSFDIQRHPFIIIVFVLCIFPYASSFQIKPGASRRHSTIVPPQTQPANLLPVVSSLIGVPVFA